MKLTKKAEKELLNDRKKSRIAKERYRKKNGR